jgi:hypothetical protein
MTQSLSRPRKGIAMAAQSPSTVGRTASGLRNVPGDQVPKTARQRQAQDAAQEGLDAALANQRALGSASSVREARESARPRPNSPAHSPSQV